MKTRLFRYTSLAILLDILNERQLTLLDPSSWADKNDAYFLKLYKNKLELKTVLALCFTEVGETYHIWKVFAGDSNGVCIEFHKDLLLEYFEGMRSGSVEYITKEKLDKRDLHDFEQLPFIKRWAFHDEGEFRIIYKDKDTVLPNKNVRIGLGCIKRIILNPWIPASVFNSVKAIIKKIDGCEELSVDKTDLVDSEKWKMLGRKIADLPDIME